MPEVTEPVHGTVCTSGLLVSPSKPELMALTLISLCSKRGGTAHDGPGFRFLMTSPASLDLLPLPLLGTLPLRPSL